MNANRLDFHHRWVPPQQSGLPTLLLLHGTGGDENDLLALGRILLPGAGVLSPRGKVVENGMPRFFRRLADGVFDLQDLRVRTAELALFVRDAAETYGFDPRNVIAAGYSNGANIAASLLLSDPDLLAGAALFHALPPFEPEPRPDLSGLPVFLSGGRTDTVVPTQQTERLGEMLRDAGANVTMHWESGGHTLARDEVAAAREWFGQVAP